MSLNREQHALFWERGFIVLRELASPQIVRELSDVTATHLADEIEPLEFEADVAYPGAPDHLDAPGGRTVRRLRGAFDRAPQLQRWATSRTLIEPVKELLESEHLSLVRGHHNCVMTKMPLFSSMTLWHQDIRYWAFSNDRLVNAWLALGPETLTNGCMQVIPGSHRLALPADRFDAQKFLRTDHPDNRALIDSAVAVELEAGDVLLFHAAAFHAAGRNKTTERKCAVVFTYHGPDTQALNHAERADSVSLCE